MAAAKNHFAQRGRSSCSAASAEASYTTVLLHINGIFHGRCERIRTSSLQQGAERKNICPALLVIVHAFLKSAWVFTEPES